MDEPTNITFSDSPILILKVDDTPSLALAISDEPLSILYVFDSEATED